MMRAALFCVFLCVVAQGAILPFLKTPKHDGIKRVCTLTAENFTAVVTAADTAVIVVSQGASKSACPSELDTFAEVTAQVLRKKNSIVCQTTPDVLNAGKTLDLSALASPGDILIYKKGRGFPYYGKRSTRALLNHLFKVNGTQVSVISGKVEKKAFDSVDQVKAVGFFMQGTPDYIAYVEVAARLSPSIAFYVVFDRTVAMHMRFSAVGEIHLFRPPNKIPTTCPYNPATAVDIEGFLRAGRGAVLSKITEQNMYDPSIIDPTKILVLAIGDGSTPMGGFFYRLITRVVRTNFNNTLFDRLNIVWIEPEMFPTIHLMMDELESTLGIPKRLPALGALNITTLQSSWFNTATLNTSGAKPADIQNSLLVQDFLNGVITNTLTPVKIGGQSFVQLPSSQTVHEHSTVVLECVIENPVGDCLWLKDGRNIGYNLDRYPHYNWRGDRISGDCSLVISGATIGRDNGEWICEMTGDDSNPTLTSPPVKLLIMTPPETATPESNFNFYASSVVTISQLMTLHFWQELYQRMLLTAGSLHVIYFVLAFYSFLYSSGLILAIITRSYKNVLQDFEVVEKNQPLLKRESTSRCDLQKGIVKSPSCKSYELFTSQVITSDKIERQTSEILECSSRSTDKSFESDRIVKDQLSENKHRRETMRSHLTSENANESVESTSHQNGIAMFFLNIHSQLRKLISSHTVEVLCMTFIATFLCITILQYSNLQVIPYEVNKIIYYAFAGETLVEVLLKLICYSPQEYFKSKWNAFDCLVLIIGGTEMVLLEVDHPILFVLRSYKLVKILVCCKTCRYLKHVMGNCIFLFRHPMSILLVFITICIVTGMQLYGYEYFYSSERFPNQDPPRWYFKDCYSSFLLVFCMLCGDWKQPMVNTVLFTSCASDLLMLIFVLIGNFVVINLFMGVIFYIYFYKSMPRTSHSKDKLQNAIQIILKGQEKFSEQKAVKESKSEEPNTSYSISSEILSETHASSSQSFKKSKRKKLRSQNEMEIVEDTASEYMADCCPSLCYFCCSFCRADENPVLWQNWADVRCGLYCFVETRLFRIAVSIVILISIVMLIIDRSYEAKYLHGAKVVETLDPCIFVLFLLEMMLKWMAYGLQKFFKSHLGRFEFFILLIYLVDILSIKFFDGQKNIFKALRSFRLLSLTPLLESYQETVPLPLKRNVCIAGSETASRESLLHLRQMECNHFLTRHCRYKPSGSREIFQMDWNVPEVHSSDLSGSKMQRIQILHKSDYSDKDPAPEASDCLPSLCYSCFPCCTTECSFFRVWTKIRTKSMTLLTSYYFIGFCMAIIVICCCKLAIESTYPEKPAIVVKVVNYADKAFVVIFALEMVMKLFALGFRRYFTTFWGVLECTVTMALTAYVLLNELNWMNLYILKLLPALRILYICRIFNYNKQSQMILKSLKSAVPSYILVFVFVSCLWLVFAVMGTAMFSKKMLHCYKKNEDHGVLSEYACNSINGTLHSVPINFDSVGNTYVALLQVATLQNWIDFVTDIMDSSDKTNYTKMQVYTATFFPLFIMFSTFLTLNFFVGITCCCFNNVKRESKVTTGTQSENLYKTAVKKMERVKLTKSIPPPKLHFPTFLYRMVTSDNFEIAGFVFIGLHMLLIALDMYDPDPSEMFALAMTELNIFFIVIFLVECAMKIVAFRQYYVLSVWNHFDLLVLILCICGALFEDLFPSPMLPAMLRLIRFLKCRRYLRRYARGMLPLLYSLYASIPAFFTMVALQFCIMFIYAVFGVHLFQKVDQLWDISGELCFKTFPKAMLLLFQLSTLAGWVDVLQSLTKYTENSVTAIIFVVSYITIVYYIVIKTHLVVILNSFDTAMYEYENILLCEDYEMFVEVWQKFDNNARGIIKFGNLPDLLDVLEEPFHFGKPNRYLIATLNIPIYEGDLVFYADVMDALTRDFMSHKAHILEASDIIPGLRNSEGKTLKKIGSSLWRQRQNYCACIIQKAWRQYTGKLAQSPVFYSEVRLASEGDKVDTFLTAEVRSSSHASV